MDSDSAEIMIGELLAGKYRLEEFLGEGGLGRVYRAVHTTVGRVVAIKILRPEHAINPASVERFLTEARAAHRVRHRHVVKVYDTGVVDGVPYIVQELLQGEDLAEYVERKGGRISPKAALERTLPILMALAHAHRTGLVHRDIKPDNIYLAKEGDFVVPKLLDFGISKLLGADTMTRKTADHVTLGTPAYMAPEQIDHAGEITPGVDVWAFGVLLYELISGTLPFEGETVRGMMRSILSGDPYSLALALPEADGRLVDIVHHCLTNRLEDRYADAGELGMDLAEYALTLKVPNAQVVLDGLRGIRLPVASNGGIRPSLRPSAVAPRRVAEDVITLSASGSHELTDVDSADHPSAPRDEGMPAPGEGSERETPSEITSIYDASAQASVDTELDSAVSTEGLVERSLAESAPQQPPTREGSRILIIALALIAVPIFALTYLAFRDAREPSQPTAPAAPAPRVEEPRRVMFTIGSRTPHAQVELRGRTYPLPLEIELDPREHPETLEVSAPGHRSRRLRVTIDRRMRIEATLEANTAPAAAASTDPRPAELPPRASRRPASRGPRQARQAADPSPPTEAPSPPPETSSSEGPTPPPRTSGPELNPYLRRD